jgi:putative peptidoglycan lipid II flippase
VAPSDSEAPERAPRRRIARNTAIFSTLTGLSRIAGLAREIVAAAFFGTTGPLSAFTLAFQVPNLFSSLFASSALSSAFIPVFTDLLERGRKREAFRLVSSLFFVILLAVGALVALFILAAGVIVPIFAGSTFSHSLTSLTVGLTRVLFPVVLLLSINGLLVGVLQVYDHFAIPALSPFVWNLVILVLLVVLRSQFHGQDQVYAYAIGVLAGTGVQLLMAIAALRRIDFRLEFAFDWRDPRVRQVFTLMLPVALTLGLINFDTLINASLGTLVSVHASSAINQAFRVYMLPQGMFSVAVTTVLFPALSEYASRRDTVGLRSTMSTGVRQILLLLLPAMAFMLVLATPVVRLIYQHGTFGPSSTDRVSLALFWFAFSLPFNGVSLLMTRTFFSLQKPWLPTKLAVANIAIDLAVSLAFYKPFGIAGLVLGTVLSNVYMTYVQAIYLRAELGGLLEGRQTTMIAARIALASLLLAASAWVVWDILDALLGRSVIAQVISVGAGGAVGLWVYVRAVLAMRVPEAQQVRRLVLSRLGGEPELAG